MLDRAAWVASGERVGLDIPSGSYDIFVRDAGAGGWCTLVHGYPTSSWDWAHVAGAIEAGHRTLAMDLLGFGASDKPAEHRYSIHEQADVVAAVWAHAGVESTQLVTHDYGDSVGQELVARVLDGTLPIEITSWQILNGGIYPDLHRPTAGQVALLDPEHGDVIAAALTPELFANAINDILGPDGAPADELAQHWDALAERGGNLLLARLIHYIHDRREHADRWIAALEAAPCPVRFIWGPEDPVSGAHVLPRLRERFGEAAIVELPGIGHYPQWEAPTDVASALLTPFPG